MVDRLRWAFEDLRGRVEEAIEDAETVRKILTLIDEVEREWKEEQ